MDIVMLGPPGSGKGTQGKKLAGHLGVPHISTGDLLRDIAATGSELGREVAGIMERGDLVSDAILARVLKERLSGLRKDGFVLDGTPRNVEQAHLVERVVPIHKAVFIDVPDPVVTERIGGRWICPVDHEEYNTASKPPKQEGVCDACGHALEQRKDDTPEGVAHRLEVYHKQTQPVLHYYALKGKLVKVDGDQPIDAVFADILSRLEKD